MLYLWSMDATRARIRTHADRSVPGETAEILAEGRVAHLGFVVDGQPFVIPMGYHFDPAEPDRLYLHGSPTSRAVRHAVSGAPLSIAVTLLEGLVYSRTALYHSMNYRSVVCFGTGREVTEAATQRRVFAGMVARYFPGRTAGRDYAEPPAEHLEATTLVEVRIEEWSAKAREGGPKGPLDSDPAAPGTSGVIPL